MNKHFKLLTILLAVILCFSVYTMSVWAVDADGDGYDDETGEYIGGSDDPVYTEPEPYYTDPVYTEPYYTDPEPYYTDPVYTEPIYSYTDPVYDPGDNSDYNNYYYDEPSYLGGDQSYIAPQSTAPSVPLKKSDSEVDVNELSGNDWKDIVSKLNNTSNSKSDGDDFGFIQNNTSAEDNGHMIMLLGIVMISLGLAGIIYIIVSKIIRRKRLAFSGNAASTNSSGSRYRSNDDYNDGFKTTKKEAKKRRRYDTGDIDLPKNSGGKRYK